MSKEKKKDIRNLIILLSIFLVIVLIIIRFKYMYGSKLDWQTQHFSFAEYFRNLFYENFNFFPSFAFNIGAGQNIYNLSYYGFLNPIILISYLLPFIKMVDYIMIFSILCVGVSVILFYKWIRNHNFSPNLSFTLSLIFLLSSPLILHSHRHIMFINYMPFLIMGLMGVDSYFKTSKRTLLMLSTFLIIMTSYYYSIPSIFVLVIYGIYCFIKKEKKITIKLFFTEGFKFLVPILIGILASSILLIPTFYVILNGRGSGTSNILLKDVILPKINLNYLLYSSYSIGLTSIFIFSLVYSLISKKRENTFFGVIISVITLIPIFVFILNGFLYINAKVLIPFIPICCLLIGYFIKDLFENKINIKKVIIPVIIISTLAILTLKWNSIIFYIIDILVMILMILLYKYKKIKFGLILSIIIISTANMLSVNLNDNLMEIKDYNYIYSSKQQILYDDVLKMDDNIYRSSNLVDSLVTTNKIYNSNYYNTSIYSSTYNAGYRSFYTNVFNNPIPYRNNIILNQVDNILWNTYMGIKYIVTDSYVPISYEKINTNGKFSIYKNDNVFPIGYASSNLMSKKEFEKLKHPYQIEALLNNIIIDDDANSNYESDIKKISLDYSNIKIENLELKKINNHINITSENNGKITIPLSTPINNDLLIIRFNMNKEQSCKKGDTSITINGITNTLTCKSWKYKNKNKTFDYVISSNENIDELVLEFKKGEYDINSINTYIYPYDKIKSVVNNLDTFKFDKKRTKGDIIEGDINVTKDGYFAISIPYDNGFKIYVDDKLQKYEKVNNTFIGFKIKKGNHHIKFIYNAPMKNISICFSLIGLISCLIISFLDSKKRGNIK